MSGSNYDWAALMLSYASLPTGAPNPSNVAHQMAAENPPRYWWRANNPMNVADFVTASQSFGTLDAGARATAKVILQPNMAVLANALLRQAPLLEYSAACHIVPWAIPDRYGSATFIASIPTPPVIEAPGFDPAPVPTPQEATEVTSWTTGGQNHVAGIVNGVAYHWWQETGGNPAGQPKWFVEQLPT